MNKFILAAALGSALLPTGALRADPQSWAHSQGRHDRYDHASDHYDRHSEARALTRRDRVWRGTDGQYHCRRSDGTTGLVIGAVGGALVGRTIDTRGDRTVGTLLGAVGGGLLGREIDRGGSRCR
jgi:hypothetical protein